MTRWFLPRGPERLAACRIIIGLFALVYLLARLPHLLSYAVFASKASGRFNPVGVWSCMSAPLDPWLYQALVIATLLLAVGFVLGVKHRVFGPAFAVCLLFVLTYRSSFGMVFHTENLLVLHVFVLGLSRSADAWSVQQRRARLHELKVSPVGNSAEYSWPLFLMTAITVSCYFLAGVTKLKISGWSWISGEVLQNAVAIDAGKKILLGGAYSPVSEVLIDYRGVFAVLVIASMMLELGAPLVLFSAKLARGWIVGVICFHWGVLALMAIFFPYPAFGFAFASMLPLERLVGAVGKRWPLRRSSLNLSQ